MILFIGLNVEDKLSKEEKKLEEREEQGFENGRSYFKLNNNILNYISIK